jgi:hypothetical protein
MSASQIGHASHTAAGIAVMAVHSALQAGAEDRAYRKQSASVAQLAAAYRAAMRENARLQRELADERGKRLALEYRLSRQ